MQQAYPDDFLKVRGDFFHARKIMIWSLVIGFIGMVLAQAFIEYVWSHWSIQVLQYLLLAPWIYYTFKAFKLESKLVKITPKQEYLLVQRDEKEFKKARFVYSALAIIPMLVIITMMILDYLYQKNLSSIEVHHFFLIVFLSGMSAFGNAAAMMYLQKLRSVYLKSKEKAE